MLAFLKTAGLFIRANPWFAAAVALLLALGAQTVRLKLAGEALKTEVAQHALTKRDLQQAQLNRQALEQGIADQAAAIDDLAEAGKRSAALARQAEKRAAEQRGRTEVLRSRLLTESRQAGGNPAAPLTPAQEEAWNALR